MVRKEAGEVCRGHQFGDLDAGMGSLHSILYVMGPEGTVTTVVARSTLL